MSKKLVIGLLVLALAFGAFGVAKVGAITQAEVDALAVALNLTAAQKASLMALVTPSTGYGMTGSAPVAPLQMGSSGAQVSALQSFLISKGFAIPAGATGFFGAQTKTALVAFQTANGIVPASGYYGSITAGKVAMMMTPVVVTPTTPSTGGSTPSSALSGGAGDVTVTLKNSGTVDQVLEGDEEAKVLGADIEANDSDISLTSAKLVFTVPSSGSTRLNRYINGVSVMLGGKTVGTADVSDFTKSGSTYTRSVALKNAVIKDGDTSRLYVAVDAVSNVDTNDLGNDWTVKLDQTRFEDATGAILTDSTSGISSTFTLEDLNTAGDVSLTVSEDDASVNNAHTVQVSNTTDTNDVDLLSFSLKAKGSDISLFTIPFTVTGSGAGATEILGDARLMMDGEEVGTVKVGTSINGTDSSFASTSAATKYITIQNLDDNDVVINDGDTVNFTLVGDINDLDGGFTTGDSLTVSLDADNINDAENSGGDQLTNTETKGTATSDGTKFAASGIMADNFVTVSTSIDDNGTNATSSDDKGVFTMTFDVTAFDQTAWVALSAASSTSATPSSAGAYLVMENTSDATVGSGTVAAVLERVSGGQMDGNYIKLDDGQTAKLRLTVTYDPTSSTFYRTQLYAINFNQSSAAAGDTQYLVSPASDFQSASVSIPN